jgi:hypothetical protein
VSRLIAASPPEPQEVSSPSPQEERPKTLPPGASD